MVYQTRAHINILNSVHLCSGRQTLGRLFERISMERDPGKGRFQYAKYSEDQEIVTECKQMRMFFAYLQVVHTCVVECDMDPRVRSEGC